MVIKTKEDLKKAQDSITPIPVVWYQAPSTVATDPTHLPFYDGVLRRLQDRAGAFPQMQFEFIFCPVTDTINLAGEAFLFTNFEQDLYNAGFRPVEVPSAGLDGQNKLAFREMILRGGKLNG